MKRTDTSLRPLAFALAALGAATGLAVGLIALGASSESVGAAAVAVVGVVNLWIMWR